MALSKLVIGLVAGIGSVAAIGGITAGIVVSNNRNIVNAVEEENETKEEKKSSAAESRNKTMVENDHSTTIKAHEPMGDESKNLEEVATAPDPQNSGLEKERGDQEAQQQTKDMNAATTPTANQQFEREGSNQMEDAGQKGDAGKIQLPQTGAGQESAPEVSSEAQEKHTESGGVSDTAVDDSQVSPSSQVGDSNQPGMGVGS